MDDRIEALTRRHVEEFAAELEEIVREKVREEFRAKLETVIGGEEPTPTRRPRKPRKKKARRAAPSKPKGARRTPDELTELDEAIVAYVKKHPGTDSTSIREALTIPKSVWKLRSDVLKKRKALRQEGERRSARYFPG